MTRTICYEFSENELKEFAEAATHTRVTKIDYVCGEVGLCFDCREEDYARCMSQFGDALIKETGFEYPELMRWDEVEDCPIIVFDYKAAKLHKVITI